jgi:hypothetical protein
MKPRSRIIQVSTTNWQDIVVITVLCEDGSVWSKINGKWYCDFEEEIEQCNGDDEIPF